MSRERVPRAVNIIPLTVSGNVVGRERDVNSTVQEKSNGQQS